MQHSGSYNFQANLNKFIAECKLAGQSNDEIISVLQARGWPKITAQRYVERNTSAVVMERALAADAEESMHDLQQRVLTLWLWITAFIGIGFVLIDLIAAHSH
jgi:heme/copper-type cytochrome/quinol oxidase subunit 3